jgi:hypothetical protein
VALTAELAATLATVALLSAFAADFAALLTGLASDFLFVTVAFNCSAAALAAALDTGFALDDAVAALVPALVSAFCAELAATLTFAENFSAVTLAFVTFAVPVGFTATVFFASVFATVAADFGVVALVAAGFALFAEVVRFFAGFFIAFAMESTANKGCLAMQARDLRVKPIYASITVRMPPAQHCLILFTSSARSIRPDEAFVRP